MRSARREAGEGRRRGVVVDSRVSARERCCCEVHRVCGCRARCMDLKEEWPYLDLDLQLHLI